jgi:5-methylcytosine-specific restriction endonuclease McrA
MAARTPDHKIDEAIKLYASGWSTTEIGEKLQISASAIARHVKLAGLTRSPSAAKEAQYTRNPAIIIPPEAGRVYGYLAGEKKTCAICGEPFAADLEHFYKRTRENGRVYLSSGCKMCVKKHRAVYRDEYPDRSLLANRVSYRKNGTRYNETKRQKVKNSPELRAYSALKNREWQSQNQDKVLAYRRARYSEFSELIKVGQRAYYIANKEKYRTLRRNRRAQLRGSPGSFTSKDIADRFEEQDGRCFWCKCDISSGHHADHFLPLARGGTNHQYNIVLACPTCNLSRGKKLPSEFFDYVKKIAGLGAQIAARREYMAQKMREHRRRERVSAAS